MTNYKFKIGERVRYDDELSDVPFHIIGRYLGKQANIYEIKSDTDHYRRGPCYEDELEKVEE